MRVTVVDPPAYTPPYDHSLCSALGARELDVELATSRFRHGRAPLPATYHREECFYRHGADRQLVKAAQHPLDMLKLAKRQRARGGVTHFQWLPIPHLDARLVNRFPRPLVMTAHDILPREASDRVKKRARDLFDDMDAVVVHTESGRARLVDGLRVPTDLVHVIPHGAFDYLTHVEHGPPIDPAAGDLEGKQVVLFFGLLRPYKGVELLIEAFAQLPDDAVLLVAGKPRMPVEPLIEQARMLGIADRVRFVPRFISDDEIPAYFRRADLVVLPYRETEQSGVLFSALAFGKPTVVTDVGGFAEVAHAGGARLVPPNDAAALAATISELLDDDAARGALAESARALALGRYSWASIAEQTEHLYHQLLTKVTN